MAVLLLPGVLMEHPLELTAEDAVDLGLIFAHRTRWTLISVSRAEVILDYEPIAFGVAYPVQSGDLIVVGDIFFRFHPDRPSPAWAA